MSNCHISVSVFFFFNLYFAHLLVEYLIKGNLNQKQTECLLKKYAKLVTIVCYEIKSYRPIFLI